MSANLASPSRINDRIRCIVEYPEGGRFEFAATPLPSRRPQQKLAGLLHGLAYWNGDGWPIRRVQQRSDRAAIHGNEEELCDRVASSQCSRALGNVLEFGDVARRQVPPDLMGRSSRNGVT